MTKHDKTDQQADDPDMVLDFGDPAPDVPDFEVVKVQPDGGPVALPVLAPETPAGDQPPAGPGADLFATWNYPAPLDEHDEQAEAGDAPDA